MNKVTARSLEGWKMEISDGRHTWTGDVPRDYGGEDAGPASFDQLLGALASCVCFITRRYAKTANLPVEGVSVEAVGDWAKDAAGQETYQIKLRAAYAGKLSDADLGKLSRAAESCPVKQAFGGRIRVEASVVRA